VACGTAELLGDGVLALKLPDSALIGALLLPELVTFRIGRVLGLALGDSG
jgi:hypothetical protein